VRRFFLCLLFFFSAGLVFSQVSGEKPTKKVEHYDVDSLFDGSSELNDYDDEPPENPVNNFLSNVLKSPGLMLRANYSIDFFFVQGWNRRPWDEDFDKDDIFKNQTVGAYLKSGLGLEIQISQHLRFWQSFKFVAPGMSMTLEEFYGDYDIKNLIYMKIGKYDYRWGISPNYPYTNLIGRIPTDGSSGDLYLAKIDIPVGVGGFQFIVYTRDGFVKEWAKLKLNNFAYGLKFNLAIPKLDLNAGALFYQRMPLRGFVSLNSTIFKSTEIYAEGLFSIMHPAMVDIVKRREEFHGKWDNPGGAVSLGVYQDFFRERLKINAEIFYNMELETSYITENNPIEKELIAYPFIQGLNMALNISYKPGGLAGLITGVNFIYNIKDNSGKVTPGIKFTPASNLNISLGIPIILGRRGGVYYGESLLDDLRIKAFSFVFSVSIGGGYTFASTDKI